MEKISKMKNKNILPIIFLSFVVIVVSLFSMTSLKNNGKSVNNDDKENEIISFYWEKGEKPVLLM